MRERPNMSLHAEWSTRPGITPARFIYVATDGFSWRVHASVNSIDGNGRGQVWHRHYYRHMSEALAVVDALIESAGGAESWISTAALRSRKAKAR